MSVLSVVFGGMLAPRILYRGFNEFLEESLRGFANGEGVVETRSIFVGPHVIRLMSHAAKVKAEKEIVFSRGTRRKARRIMTKVIDPFFDSNPNGVLVLGGHSFGSVEMQCMREMVESKYGAGAIAAAFALAPVAHELDPDVKVIIGTRDRMVPMADVLTAGRAVGGERVSVPGPDHMMVHNSPRVRQLLADFFATRPAWRSRVNDAKSIEPTRRRWDRTQGAKWHLIGRMTRSALEPTRL